MKASKSMQEYFESINKEVLSSYAIAEKARKEGYDPEEKVDIPLARNMAERVEGLISAVAPQLTGSGISEKIQELEKKYSSLDWRVALLISEEVAKQKFCKFETEKEAMEIAIRVGLAYITLGVISAPLEGFIELRIKERQDGKKYVAPFFAGPIRAAGGTAAAVSLVITDYVRLKMGYEKYDPSESEVKRYCTEIQDYHERVTNLQYYPSQEEITFMVQHLPVEINGDPTEKFEVSNHKDQPRIETNRIRGGLCLVLAEGISQKAPKVWKRLEQWGEEFGLDWGFLKEFLDLQKKIKAKSDKGTSDKITPNYTFIADLVAGRPVLAFPMAKGGFRLRYGRGRVSGFSAASIHPTTMFLLNNYIATGTQLKMERPGKAASITPCESIEGPIIKLKSGEVVRIHSIKQIKELFSQVKEILFLGDILFNYGDFSENGHKLIPPGYCEEWWAKELKKAILEKQKKIDIEQIATTFNEDKNNLLFLTEDPLQIPSLKLTTKLSKEFDVPLHPHYTYYWDLIKHKDLSLILEWFEQMQIIKEGDKLIKIILPSNKEAKRALELLGVPHLHINKEFVVIEGETAQALLLSLNITTKEDVKKKRDIIQEHEDYNVLNLINLLSPLRIRDKAGFFIGARMGRPEKAKMRKLTGSPQVLFPVGEEGGRLRCFQAALDAGGKINSVFPTFYCEKCKKETVYSRCQTCDNKTTKKYYCNVCGLIDKEECQHGIQRRSKSTELDVTEYFKDAIKKSGAATYPDLIKGVRGTSNKDHVLEHLLKGILRAKHKIYVNKDGTTRYDMSELPLTHFKPKEIGTSIEKLKELGYKQDIHKKELINKEQILELKPQDLVLPACPDSPEDPADKVLFNISNFIDELLIRLYKLKPYYNLKTKEDLVGHLIIGLAPHTSAGMVGRIIGFSQTQGMFAHPLFHAALRRDCDGDEACAVLLMDAFLNFSRQYLPDKRGGRTMDAPLVLTSKLIPSEVDDMVLGLDVVYDYPLEFYEAALEYKKPWEVKVEQIKDRIGTELQYENIGFTHDTPDINEGVLCSAYKILPSMQEKLAGQMDLAEKIRAVDESEVAALVINKHFIKDTRGNLRKFSTQQFRCVSCNEKYRRPPLIGKCSKCGGKIIFTVSEGSIVKYLGPSISLAEKYNISPYIKQNLELLKRRVENVFGKDKEKQIGLGSWFSTQPKS